MGEPLETLVALHQCDGVLFALRRESEEIPRAVEALESQIEQAAARVREEHEAIEETEKRRRGHERELQECESQRDKYEQQTVQVKTNTEYTALLNEIDGARRRIGELEEAILQEMEEVESRTERARAVGEEQKRVQRELGQQLEAYRRRLGEVESEIEARVAERAGLIEQVERAPRALYERIHAARGSGTARIRGRSCDACHRDVPFELINRVRAGEVHACGSCQRILVVLPEVEE